jgi:hypothetical protein
VEEFTDTEEGSDGEDGKGEEEDEPDHEADQVVWEKDERVRAESDDGESDHSDSYPDEEMQSWFVPDGFEVCCVRRPFLLGDVSGQFALFHLTMLVYAYVWQVVNKKPDFFRGDKLPAGTQIMFRFWPEGWMQGTVLGRSIVRGHNFRVEYTDGQALDMALREEAYAFGEQPSNRVGIWCRIQTVSEVDV